MTDKNVKICFFPPIILLFPSCHSERSEESGHDLKMSGLCQMMAGE
jgi:hypothetical protein